MTDLANQIAALSAAATPGQLMIVPYGDGDSLVLHVVNSETRICFMATPANDGDMRRIKANTKLLLELWNHRAELIAALRAADEAEALRARVAELERLLSAAKEAADALLAPVCAASGRYIYDWADCPDMIAELASEDVVISAKIFADLYEATNWEAKP